MALAFWAGLLDGFAEAIEDLVDGFTDGRSAGESRELDFTPWGGAYNRVPAEATAFAHRSELFLLKQAAVLDAGASDSAREGAEVDEVEPKPVGRNE